MMQISKVSSSCMNIQKNKMERALSFLQILLYMFVYDLHMHVRDLKMDKGQRELLNMVEN